MTMSTQLTFKAVLAKQSDTHKVISFAATASEIHQSANIDHVARDSSGTIQGFGRPQSASQINEIRDYLEGDDAVLPKPIVVAFTDRAFVEKTEDGSVELQILRTASGCCCCRIRWRDGLGSNVSRPVLGWRKP